MKNKIESKKLTFLEGFGDPILRYFWIVFLIRNWKPISILIFGQGYIENRITLVEDKYSFPYNFENILQSSLNLVLPAAIAIAMFFIYPNIKKYILIFWEKKLVELENSKNIINEKILLDQEKTELLYKKISSLEKENKSLKERSFNFDKFSEIVKTGAATIYGDTNEAYELAYLDNFSYTALVSNSGVWLIFDDKEKKARIYKNEHQNEIKANERPALVIKALESNYALIKIKGEIDFNKHPDLKLISYNKNYNYILTEGKLGIPKEIMNPTIQERTLEVCKCIEDNIIQIASTRPTKGGFRMFLTPDENDSIASIG